MNKRFMWISGVLVVFAIIVFSMYRTGASSTDPELSAEEISNLVQAQYPGNHEDPVLSVKDGEPVYQVEINQDTGSYSVVMHGDTGRVLDLQSKEQTHGSQNNTDRESMSKGTEDENSHTDDNETTKNDSNNDNTKRTDNDESKKNEQTSEEKRDAIISSDEAKEIALREFSGTITELELDEDDGMLIYEVEVADGDREANIEINAYTGNVVVIEIDD